MDACCSSTIDSSLVAARREGSIQSEGNRQHHTHETLHSDEGNRSRTCFYLAVFSACMHSMLTPRGSAPRTSALQAPPATHTEILKNCQTAARGEAPCPTGSNNRIRCHTETASITSELPLLTMRPAQSLYETRPFAQPSPQNGCKEEPWFHNHHKGRSTFAGA